MTQTIEAHSQPGPTRSPVFKGITLAVLLVVIAGCATGDVGTKTAIGGLGGAALGGLIAGAAGGGGAAIAAGVVGGALFAGLVGNMLDERDKRMAAQSQNRALETTPSGQSVAWNNPDSGSFRLRDTHPNVPVRWDLLPRVSTDRDHRGQAGTVVRDGVPSARWQLEGERRRWSADSCPARVPGGGRASPSSPSSSWPRSQRPPRRRGHPTWARSSRTMIGTATARSTGRSFTA